ncbi:MAG TPA: ABC transporter [Ruminococcus sp.]|nr:ABC transporter [Ruminococcus sp.]
MNAIEIKNLKKNFKDFSLQDLNLTLPQGCIMGLIGENGAGKSTTIRMMLGLARPDGGSIRLLGKENPQEDMAVKNDLGVVLDEVGLPHSATVRDVERIMRCSFKNWDSDVYWGYIKQFGLPEKKGFIKFSKGMKMKLGIAVALSHHAKLLILDEPTSGLDPLVRDEIIEILNDFTRDESHSILISSHIVSDLEKICDYIAFLHKGKLMLCEEKDILLEQYGFLQTTAENLDSLDPAAIKGRKKLPYGAEAIVDRNLVPQSFDIRPVTIEELFVYMAKEN